MHQQNQRRGEYGQLFYLIIGQYFSMIFRLGNSLSVHREENKVGLESRLSVLRGRDSCIYFFNAFQAASCGHWRSAGRTRRFKP